MTLQFNRKIELRIIGATDTLIINKDLDLQFECKKDRSSTPNELIFRALNLSLDSRQFIRANGTIEIYTGYGDALDLLARVDVLKSITTFEPPNSITEITCMDGLKVLRDKEITLSFKAGVTVAHALSRIVAQMGIKSREIDIDLNIPLKSGYTHSGKATDALDDVLGYVKGVWGIVNNVLIITTRGKGVGQPVLKISPQNGLIGQPALTEDTFTYERILHVDKTKKQRVKQAKQPKRLTKKEAKKRGVKYIPPLKRKVGKSKPVYKLVTVDVEKIDKEQETVDGVEFEMLLRPNVNPFDRIELESRFVNGIYVVDKVDHTGSTRGGDYLTRITAYKEA